MPAALASLASAVVLTVVGGLLDDGSSDAAAQAGQASGAAALKAAQIAEDQWNYYKENYQPIEKSLTERAPGFGSEAEQEEAAAEAAGQLDVLALGKGLPAQATAGLASAASASANTALALGRQAQQNQVGLAPIVSAAQKGLGKIISLPTQTPDFNPGSNWDVSFDGTFA